MSDPTGEKPTATARYGQDGPVAEAFGPGAASGASKLDAFVQGLTAAGVSQDGQAHVLAPLDPTEVAKLKTSIDRFSEDMRAAVIACLLAARQQLEASHAQSIALAQVKSTVDELWANNVAAELRDGGMMETVAKKLLEAALGLGLGGLVALVEPYLPK